MKKRKQKMIGLFELQDMALAEYLNLSVDSFAKITERIDYDELQEILWPMFFEEYPEEDMEAARQRFYKHLTPEEWEEVESIKNRKRGIVKRAMVWVKRKK